MRTLIFSIINIGKLKDKVILLQIVHVVGVSIYVYSDEHYIFILEVLRNPIRSVLRTCVDKHNQFMKSASNK